MTAPDAPAFDLSAAARQLAEVASGIGDDQLAAPTPCTGIPVGGLLSHVLGLSEAFRAAAAKTPDSGTPPGSGPLPELPAGWRQELPDRLDALVKAWQVPDAWTGEATAGGATMAAPQIATVALDELVLHGWDLAAATGQPYAVRPEDVRTCLGFVEPTAQPEGVPGLFGPPVPVAPDAPALDRLLGLSGRDPRWSPSA